MKYNRGEMGARVQHICKFLNTVYGSLLVAHSKDRARRSFSRLRIEIELSFKKPTLGMPLLLDPEQLLLTQKSLIYSSSSLRLQRKDTNDDFVVCGVDVALVGRQQTRRIE